MEYKKPEMEIIVFRKRDVVKTSPGSLENVGGEVWDDGFDL